MARRPTKHPTDAELEILKALWESGPSGLGEVCAALRLQRPVATTTVATTLGIMLGKGLVRRGRGPRGYVWSAAVSPQTAARQVVGRLLDHLFDGSARRLVAHLIDAGNLEKRDLDEIQRMLDASVKRSAEKEARP